MDPHAFPRRILLAVTGMSPQIVTETLYALVTQQGFVPTEIRLVTTAYGRNRALHDLLGIGATTGSRGHFHALCADYGWHGIRFDETCIEVIEDAAGHPLDDIRTPEENTLAADKLTRVVQALCADPDAAVHASIAGGRKTMGFYLGYALSLFARPQDALSHVLVAEPYEQCRQFFYPSPQPRELVLENGAKVDASAAQVMLAGIPLVHLRDGLPDTLLGGMDSYSQAVAAAQAGLGEASLHFDLAARTVRGFGRPLELPDLLFALLLWMCRRRKADAPLALDDAQAVAGFVACYREVAPGDSRHAENAIAALSDPATDFAAWFRSKRSRLEAALRAQLGRQRAACFAIERGGHHTRARYSLALPASQIHLREAAARRVSAVR